MQEKRKEMLREAIDRIPRVHLAYLPTPLEEMPRLSKALGGPRIFFKREDLTGLPLTGNKTRMFEFSLAEALKQKAEVVLGSAAVQSNYCRQLAAACSKLGLETYLYLRNVRGKNDQEIQGNLLIDLLVGAKVKVVHADVSKRREVKEKALQELKQQLVGKKIYVARGTERDTALETVAYVECGLELAIQLAAMGISADYIYTASLDTTQAGLLVASKFLREPWNIVGISPFGKELEVAETIHKTARNVASLLGIEVDLSSEDIVNYSEYAGRGYGFMSEAGREAIKLVGRTEGVILDPVYTGKAMSALIHDIDTGLLTSDHTVVFILTGGFPSIFAYSQDFALEENIYWDDNRPYAG